jgi:HK97 family phage prohead protease
MKLERLYLQTELRALGEEDEEDEEDEFAIEGYAATFDGEADLGDFRERCNPRCFTRALQEGQEVRCLRNHDPNFVLGRTKNRTLQLMADNRGLRFRCQLDRSNPEHRATHSMIRRGDLDGCSFAFLPNRNGGDTWSQVRGADGNLYALRELLDVDLQDVSVCTYPAYNSTSVQARSALFFPDGQSAEMRSAIEQHRSNNSLRTDSPDAPSQEELERQLRAIRLW